MRVGGRSSHPARALSSVRRRDHVLADRGSGKRGGRHRGARPADSAQRSSQSCWGRATVEAVERVASAVGLSDTSFPLQELFWGIRRLFDDPGSPTPRRRRVRGSPLGRATFLDLVEHLTDTLEDAARPPMRHTTRSARAEFPTGRAGLHAARGHPRAPDDSRERAGDRQPPRERGAATDVVRARIVAGRRGKSALRRAAPLDVHRRRPGSLRGGRMASPTELLRSRSRRPFRHSSPRDSTRWVAEERAVIDPASVIGYVFPAGRRARARRRRRSATRCAPISTSSAESSSCGPIPPSALRGCVPVPTRADPRRRRTTVS